MASLRVFGALNKITKFNHAFHINKNIQLPGNLQDYCFSSIHPIFGVVMNTIQSIQIPLSNENVFFLYSELWSMQTSRIEKMITEKL